MGTMDIRKLENESLLQLYVSGELSAEDRAELEAQLRVDSSLLAQLHEVQSLQDQTDASLSNLDRLDPIVPSDVSERFLMRRLRQRIVEIAARPKPVLKQRRVSKLAWTGIAAAAAVVVFCLFILNSSVHDNLSPTIKLDAPDSLASDNGSIAPASPDEPVRQSQVALVSEDQSSQKLAKLEILVHDDLQDAWH